MCAYMCEYMCVYIYVLIKNSYIFISIYRFLLDRLRAKHAILLDGCTRTIIFFK